VVQYGFLLHFDTDNCLLKKFDYIYSGALTIIRLNGSKEIGQTNNIKAKELPKWEINVLIISDEI
jgi:hypothetical protein